MNKKILVIVAHPDDETIWMGGTLLRYSEKKWDITIISLCRKNDRDREPKFRKICEILNSKCFISDLEDEKLNNIDLNEIIKRIKKFADKEYDYIFTHGENGEYGHIRHKEVNNAVKEMVKRKLIKCKKIFFFSYVKKEDHCIYNSNADKLIKLNNLEFLTKKHLIKNVYGFLKGGFEEKSCGNLESFNEKKYEMFSALSLPCRI